MTTVRESAPRRATVDADDNWIIRDFRAQQLLLAGVVGTSLPVAGNLLHVLNVNRYRFQGDGA